MAQFRSRLCKPTAAMCLLGLLFLLGPSDFPLSRPVFSPCHTFCHSFATCVASAFARNASWPFRCHVCCQGLLPAAEISPLNLPPVLFPHPRICQCFFATNVAITFAPVGADCHCHCFCPRDCHRCCHQIWVPKRALFLNFRSGAALGMTWPHIFVAGAVL